MIAQIYQALGYTVGPDDQYDVTLGADGSVIWRHTDIQPTYQEIIDYGNDAIALPSGELFSEWFASHGGNPVATAKRLAKELYTRQDEQGRQIRAALQAIVDVFNRHSNKAFAGLSVISQQAPQSITPTTPTKITNWEVNSDSFLAIPSAANNQITLGEAGSYIVSLNASYAISLGIDCDMTWTIYANGIEVPELRARQQVITGVPSIIAIGPLALRAPSDSIVLDVRVQHNEAGVRNLILGPSQFHVERIPTIPTRTFDDLKTAVENAIDQE